MGNGLECQARDVGIYPEGSGEPFNCFSSGVTGLELHFREIKPVEGRKIDYGRGRVEVRRLIRRSLKRPR